MVRWLWLHVHDRIDIRLLGPDAGHERTEIPQHIVLYRGFKDVWDTRVRVSYWWRERVRVGAMLRVETSAVDTAAVNAAAVDGLKVRAGRPDRVPHAAPALARRRLRYHLHALP